MCCASEMGGWCGCSEVAVLNCSLLGCCTFSHKWVIWASMFCCWFMFSALRVAMSVWRLLNISCCWFMFSERRVAISVWRLLNISAMFCNNDVI